MNCCDPANRRRLMGPAITSLRSRGAIYSGRHLGALRAGSPVRPQIDVARRIACALETLRESRAVTVIPSLGLATAVPGGVGLCGHDVEHRDSQDHRECSCDIVALQVAAAHCARERGDVECVSADAAPESRSSLCGERQQAVADLARATSSHETLATPQAQRTRVARRGEYLRNTERDRQPPQGACELIRTAERARTALQYPGIALGTNYAGCLRHEVHVVTSSNPGLSTTLMQLSCLLRNTLYISGPSSSPAVCVITKLGSICSDLIRSSSSSVQRLTCV